MKAYKTEEMNLLLRENVRKCEDYLNEHLSCSRKYLSNDEFALDMCHICDCSYGMGKKITWIVRADGERDQQAMKVFGFNRHTA